MKGFALPLDSSPFRALSWTGLIPLVASGGVVVFPQAAKAAEASDTTNRMKDSPLQNSARESGTLDPQEKSQVGKALNTPSRKPKLGTKEMALGVGAGVLLPLPRPSISLSFSALSKTWATSIRATGSYTQLSSSFESAVKDSEYSKKIQKTDAYLWDVELAVPELSLNLPLNTYVAATPTLRTSRCVSNFITIAGEPLVFSGWAIAAGGAAKAGYRHSLIANNLSIEFFGGLNWPLWSYGATDLVYVRQGTGGVETFSDTDLVSMLDSLQPYLQNLSNHPTTQVGVSAAWRF